MAGVVERRHLIAMMERMLLDDEKDVTFELADGTEQAHRAVLKAASEVFAGMFRQGMREKFEGVVALPAVSRSAMRVFLRLIYVGYVDPSDWEEDAQASDSDHGVLRKAYVEVQRRGAVTCLTPTGRIPIVNWVLLDTGGAKNIEFTLQSDVWQQGDIMIGIAPSCAQLGDNLYQTPGFYGFLSSGNFNRLYAQDGTSDKPFHATWPSPLPSGATISVSFNEGSLVFSVNGGHATVAKFNTPIPEDVCYVPAMCFVNRTSSVEVATISAPKCPLAILLAVASLAKKYMVSSVHSLTTQVLKRRIANAKLCECTATFQHILASAIAEDMGAVRMAALEAAKDFAKLREEYDAGKLQPEVAFELEAIWPSPSGAPCKLQCLA